MTRSRMVPDPDDPGRHVEGELVRIADVREGPPSYVTLDDGTELTHRVSVLEVVRVKDRWDAKGNPLYSITINATLQVTAPESLRRKEN